MYKFNFRRLYIYMNVFSDTAAWNPSYAPKTRYDNIIYFVYT